MKKLYCFFIFIFSLCILSNDVFAQSTANYTYSTTTTGSLVDMSSGTSQLIGPGQDDAASSLTSVGFDFWFMGTRYSTFSLSSNGAVRLGTTVISGTAYGSTFPVASVPMLAPFWGDLSTGFPDSKIHYKVTGSAPNRVLVIEWKNMLVCYASLTYDATFQCIVYENTNNIEYRYGTMQYSNLTDPVAAVGISATNTANNYASVDQDLMTSSTSTITNKTYLATGPITNFTSGADGSRRTILYSPVPTTAPSGVNFTSVGALGMTVNWTDNSADENGFAVYKSTNGGSSYSFVIKTAANAVSTVVSNLVPNTNYTFAVYAVREALSSAATGSQATLAGSFSGNKLIGPTGDFPSITAAITSMKSLFLSGATILELQPTYTSAGETFPLDFSAIGTSATNTVIIRPQTGAVGLIITGSNTTAIMTFGTSYVSLDGRPGGSGSPQLSIINTSTGPVARFINDASFCELRSCTLTGGVTSTASGVVLFTTSVGGLTGNSNNSVNNNIITSGVTNSANLVYSSGTTGIPNSNNIIFNNVMSNFTSAGVNLTATGNGDGWNISNNQIFNTIISAVAQNGIVVSSASSSNITISNNGIGGNAPGPTGVWANSGNVTVIGISVANGVANVTNNTVAGITTTNVGTATRIRGISITTTLTGCNATGNVVRDLLSFGAATGVAGTSPGVSGIIFNPTGFQSGNISNNEIYNLSMENTSALTTTCVTAGIVITNSTAIFNANRIYNLKNKTTGITAGQPPVVAGIMTRFMAPGNIISNNMISIGGSENTNTQFNGIWVISTGVNPQNYYYNSVYVSGTSGGTWSSYALLRGDNTAVTPSPAITAANNIFVNTRTGGGSINYAVGNQGTNAGVNPWITDYNMFHNADPLTVGLWDATAQTFSGWKTVSGGDDINSLSATLLTPANLFTDAATGNLHIIPGNTEAWLSNGNGLPLADVGTDYDGNVRSITIPGGATDIGADEFIPTSAPPSITNNITANGTYEFVHNGKSIGQIVIAGFTAPFDISWKHYSGVNPPGGGAQEYTNSFDSVWVSSGSFNAASYEIRIFLYLNELRNITNANNAVLAKSNNGGASYTPSPGATNGYTAGTPGFVYATGLTSFSLFTITSTDAPLPIELSSFTSIVNRNEVKLNWSTTMEENNSGFDIERKFVSENTWSKVGNITGNGTTNETKNYSYTDRGLNTGKYNYRLKQIDFNGNFKYFDLSNEVIVGVPADFKLSQNYPNPFNPSTKIDYDLPVDSKVGIRIYDMIGREVAVLVNDQVQAGYYTVQLNGINMASGTYFFRLIAKGTNGKEFVMTKKMQLIK